MSKKLDSKKNLPSVSKQTAGGITGAVIGGMVAGPVGAVAAGIAGAFVGDSSAKGNEPIQKTIETVRLAGGRGVKAIKAARDRNKSARLGKQSTKGSAAKTAPSKPALVDQKREAKPAKKKVSSAAKSKVASRPKTKGIPKRAKKKA